MKSLKNNIGFLQGKDFLKLLDFTPEAYTPFNSGCPIITTDGNIHTVSLPEKAPFIILYLKKQP